MHDATVGFQPSPANWRAGAGAPGGGEVICHNDVAPDNTVFVAGRPVAFIDWDFAAPGPRVWDLAYAAYRFVPLAAEEHLHALGVPGPVDQPGRLRLLCEAYGLLDRAGLIDVLLARLRGLCELLIGQAADGHPAFQRHLAEGHVQLYRRDLAFIQAQQQRLERAC